jgi:hypothetical protein
MPCNDCSRAEDYSPCVSEPEGSESSSSDEACLCGHLRLVHDSIGCGGCPNEGDFWEHAFQAPTPEKAASLLTEDLQDMEASAPPQPPRRPPYAVAYSVDGGHLYEVMVPGDATCVAEDGVIKIQHHGHVVLGLLRVQPVNLNEESDAEADHR